MKKEDYSTAEILQGIKVGDDHILRFVYRNYYEAIKLLVMEKNGSEELAKDIFQEAIIVIYKKSQNKGFEIKQSSFYTYFYAVCSITLKNYFKNLNKDLLYHTVELEEQLEDDAWDVDMESLIKEGMKENLFHKHLSKIPEGCVKIFQLVLKGIKAKEISRKLGFTSEAYVRKRKSFCLKTLIKLINDDPNLRKVL